MNHNPLKVMIIGAGSGGLCLAQGLKSAGVAVEVFERDFSPTDRLQGYRLSISALGCRALKDCLPDALFERFVASSANPSQSVTFLDHRLHRLLALDLPRIDRTAVDCERPVGRIALRRVLLEGLDGIVHFGKRFVAFENAPTGAVTARFEDGSTATGDVLVGADGAGSHVRAQLLPDAKRVQTGIMIISGKFELRHRARGETPQAMWRGPTLILGPKGRFMFGNAVEYGDADDGRPSRGACDDLSQDRENYVMWGVSARREAFAVPNRLETLSKEELKAAALGLMVGWRPALRRLVEGSQESTLGTFPVKTSVPIPPWNTGNVTLLGDALHNMTPFQGIGANTALRDADALRRALVATDRGERNLIPALADYERDMLDYGFRAVGASLRQMKRLHAENPLVRAFNKAFFRMADRLPPLKAMLLRRE